MAIELLIDGMLSGTGIRNAVNGGYVDPTTLGLSEHLTRKLALWQSQYEQAHFADFPADRVSALDDEGQTLASKIGEERPDTKVGYFSHGCMKRLV